VLGAIDDPAAREVLKRAPFDPEVMYPDVILGAADHFPKNGALVEVFDAWLAKPEADFRTRWWARRSCGETGYSAREFRTGFSAFVDRAFADPSSRVRSRPWAGRPAWRRWRGCETAWSRRMGISAGGP
jgi:hypothetical protein